MEEKITYETQVLIDKAKLGDNEAINKLFYRYRPRVLRVVRIRLSRSIPPEHQKKLRLNMQSEDIVQEALIVASQKLKDFKFEEDGDFIHWLSGIVKNYMRDQIDHYFAQKRHAHKGEVHLDEEVKSDSGSGIILADIIPSDDTSPTGFARRQEVKESFDNLILKLEDELDQEIVIQYLLEKRTFAKIAQDPDLDIKTEDAARKRFNRAYEKLLSLIESDPTFKEYKNDGF